MDQALNLIVPHARPASRRSSSMGPGGSAARNKRRNSIIVDSVLRRSSILRGSRAADCAAPHRGGFGFGGGAQVRRWDGHKRAKSDWDAIRRDSELRFPDGDALVHLYAKGHSRRGPSFQLSMADLEQSNCEPFLSEAVVDKPDGPPQPDAAEDEADFAANPRREGKWQLYVPAPSLLQRQDALRYHLTTRNFFAWMFDKPLVGVKLGESLIALHERMNLWRPDREQNQDDMLAYIDSQGYTDFRDCPDHALGVLQYAEQFELSELWIDAFVHCAGMNDRLITSGDFHGLSRTTKALVTRANLEMGVRLQRSSISIASFMEDDLGFLHLPDPVARHVERFRSFLHSYYVQRNGYWPPISSKPDRPTPLPKHTLLGMYSDFRDLYELLADTSSAPSSSSPAATTGFNVAATLGTFDRRQKFSPLPHGMPRLPENLPDVSESRFSSLLPYFLRRSKVEQRTGALAALHHATNVSSDTASMNSPLVIEYYRLEREYTLNEEERLSPADARKARFLLIYATLQTLADVTRAAPEVRDTDGVDYALCCQTAGTPPWSPTAPHAARPALTAPPSEHHHHHPPLRRAVSHDTLSSYATGQSGAPSARVDPLDLELVASRRQSYAAASDAPPRSVRRRSSSVPRAPLHISTATPPIRPPSLARRLAGADDKTPVHSPKPRRASLKEQALIATYEAEHIPEEGAEDVPDLSPARATEAEADDRRSSSEEASSAASEADTPTSARFGPVIFQEGVPAPPSPSIYDEEVDSPTRSEFNLLLGSRKPDSDELARRWQGEIGSM